MGISSMHIQGASAGSILHNARENFSYSVVFTDEKNECDHNAKKAYEIYRQELAIRSEAYSARTKQKLQKNALTQLSAIFNLEKHHTLKDLIPLKKYIEKELDTVVYQMSIHRDEGKLVHKQTKKELYSGKEFFRNLEDDELYFDKDYTQKINMDEYDIKKNYHAHIEMMGIDSDGSAIKRNKLSKFQLSKMQTKVAEILGMQRGVLGSKAKRRDTHQFKERGSEQQEMKMTVQSLKAEIERLRKEMAEAKQFTKEDYQALNKLKKTIKKDTLEDTVDEFLAFKKRIEAEKEELQKELKEKEAFLAGAVEAQNKFRKTAIDYMSKLSEAEKKLISSNEIKEKIEEENQALKAKKPKIVEVENPINVELEKEIAELKKDVYSSKYKNKKKEPIKNADIVEYFVKEKEKLEKELITVNEIAKKPKIIKVENPINVELEKEIVELKKEVSYLKSMHEKAEEKPKTTLTEEELETFRTKVANIDLKNISKFVEIRNTILLEDPLYSEKHIIMKEELKKQQAIKKPTITREDLRSDTLKLKRNENKTLERERL